MLSFVIFIELILRVAIYPWCRLHCL